MIDYQTGLLPPVLVLRSLLTEGTGGRFWYSDSMVEAANSVRISCPEFGSYYQKKFREATRHKHRRALVLTVRKLVRLVHSMLRSGWIYQPTGTRGSR